jgi:hypothetical protein
MPSINITHFTPDWLNTSRSKRATALGPALKVKTRLPLIPMFPTAIFAVSLRAASLAASSAGQV